MVKLDANNREILRQGIMGANGFNNYARFSQHAAIAEAVEIFLGRDILREERQAAYDVLPADKKHAMAGLPAYYDHYGPASYGASMMTVAALYAVAVDHGMEEYHLEDQVLSFLTNPNNQLALYVRFPALTPERTQKIAARYNEYKWKFE